MSYNILYKKRIEESNKKFKYTKVFPTFEKYFLLCGSCFWMASTLPHSSNVYAKYLNRCPNCKDWLDKFLISND